MPKSVWMLAILLVAALAWAYRLGHAPKEAPSASRNTVEVWNIDPADVERITLFSKKGTIRLEPESSPGEIATYVWVTSELRPDAPRRKKPRGKIKVGNAPVEPEGFKGNPAAEKAIKTLSRLNARRRIGILADLADKSFGLPSDSEEHLLLERKGAGAPLRLNLGGFNYGKTHRYVHDTRDDTVYLVSAATLDALSRGKTRLLDRRLLSSPVRTAARVELQVGQNVVMLWKLQSQEGGPGQWGKNPDDTEGNSAYQDWMNRLNRVRVNGFIQESGIDANPILELDIRLQWTEEDKPDAWIKLLRDGEGGAWQTVSSHTRRPATIDQRQANELVEAAKKLLLTSETQE